MRTLVVTNDFPPRPGGIQQFVHALASRLPHDEVVVYAPKWKRDALFDREQPFPVVRHPTSLMLPVPDVLRRARAIARAERCDTVWFGAAAPLGLLAGPLRGDVRRAVASTHGHEVGWARLPGARQVLRRIGRLNDVVTYLGDYTRSRLALGDRPTIVCVSRLVPRKGQDALIRALPSIRETVRGAALLVVGGGPDMPRLQRLAAECGVADHVRFTGSVPWSELPAHYAAGDVFAMPCRTRLGGIDVEGLGIVYLEAAATGLPVVAGDSGGAPDAVLDGETGVVVDGRDVAWVAREVSTLLADPAKAAAMGAAGRAWVEERWRWDVLATRLRGLLAGDDR